MSFWGMSQTGQDARRRLNEAPAWDWQQAQDWWGIQNGQLPVADYLQRQFITRNTDLFNEGFGSPDMIRGYGRQIMPGVEPAMAARRGRDAAARGASAGITPAGDVGGQLSGLTDEMGRNITGAYDEVGGNIRDTYSRARAASDQTGREVVGNIDDTYGAAATNSGNSFRDMRGNVGRTFDQQFGAIDTAYTDLDTAADASFGRRDATIDRLNPNSEFRGARVARAFAPQAASTAMRLRRAGVDPNSAEGNAAMQRVETGRARAMDDAYADENTRFVNTSLTNERDRFNTEAGLTTDKLDTGLRTSTGRIDRETDIDMGNEAVGRGLTLARGQDFRDEVRRQEGVQRGYDIDQMDRNNANANTTYGRAQDYVGARRGDVMAGRDLQIDDFNRNLFLDDRENQTDITGIDLDQAQWNAGAGYRGADLGVRTGATQAGAAAGQDAWGRAVTAGRMGGDYSRQAQQGWGNTVARETPGAGWGLKLLAGLGGTALGMIPGASTAAKVARGVGGVMGGMGGFGNSGQLARTPPFNPARR